VEPPLFEPSSPSIEPSSPSIQPGSPSVEPGSSTIEPGSSTIEPGSPSIEPGCPIIITEDEAVAEQWSPPPSPSPLANNTPNNRQLQAQEEMRQHFSWLPGLIEKNNDAGWGTGYRDFVDVSCLLCAVRELGMVERPNSVTLGRFQVTTGDVFTLDVVTFIDVMQLNHTQGTWRNKFTMYFRLKALHLYSEDTGGEMFWTSQYRTAWEKYLSKWTSNQGKMLPVNTVTTRFGVTELRPLVKGMVNEAKQSKWPNKFPSNYVQC
jgi:hypothetical protein